MINTNYDYGASHTQQRGLRDYGTLILRAKTTIQGVTARLQHEQHEQHELIEALGRDRSYAVLAR